MKNGSFDSGSQENGLCFVFHYRFTEGTNVKTPAPGPALQVLSRLSDGRQALTKAQSLKVVLSEHTVWVRTCVSEVGTSNAWPCVSLAVTFRVLGFHKSTLVFSWKEQLHGLRRRKLGLVALHWYSKQLHETTWTNIARGAPQKSFLPPLQINGLIRKSRTHF